MSYAENRYENMLYRRCGRSGLMLPAISLGLWHNFGINTEFETQRRMIKTAFELGITHFDLANNYGPPAGSAEENFGNILKCDFAEHRDELIISTKAGYNMWPGPYGNWGSRKYIISSCDQSLKRMGIDYVDIFYHHRPDPETPLEETMQALADLIRQGKALYVGISNYKAEDAQNAIQILKELGVHCLIHQAKYNMIERWVEDGLLDILKNEGVGSIAFCPLAQGQLTNRYFDGLPEDSRASGKSVFLNVNSIKEETVNKVRLLDKIAAERGQTMAQMALVWVLRHGRVTSALIGASRPSQIVENVKALKKIDFSDEELKKIDAILNS
jgi:L-glyceraldehyde 3-phosphate reductase